MYDYLFEQHGGSLKLMGPHLLIFLFTILSFKLVYSPHLQFSLLACPIYPFENNYSSYSHIIQVHCVKLL